MKREELIARLRELANDGVLSTKYAAAVFQAAAMLEADGKGVNSTHTPNKPDYCGSGHCSCIECPFEEQEPVAWLLYIGDSPDWSYADCEEDADFYGKQSGLPYVKKPLYASPVTQRPRLTEEEILKIVRDASRGSATRRDGTTSMRIARAIEAKVRGE